MCTLLGVHQKPAVHTRSGSWSCLERFFLRGNTCTYTVPVKCTTVFLSTLLGFGLALHCWAPTAGSLTKLKGSKVDERMASGRGFGRVTDVARAALALWGYYG